MPLDEGQPSDRPALQHEHRRSSSSRLQRQTDTSSDSPANSPPSTAYKAKSGTRAHVVGARLHKRVPSYGTNLHKNTKPHTEAHTSSKAPRRPASPGPSASPPSETMPHVSSETKLPRNGSTTSLKKNHSQVSLKRNRSTAEINYRPKSASGLKRTLSQPGLKKKDLRRASVHFDIGHDANEDGWTEASNSASPSLSRTNSVGRSSGQNSAKLPASANRSMAPSPDESPRRSTDPSHNTLHRTVTPDARQITDRLLQRTSSHSAAPQMSSIMASATASAGSPDPFGRSATTAPGTPGTPAIVGSNEEEITSRFVGSTAGTPGENSPFPNRTTQRNELKTDLSAAKRVKSMGNLSRHNSSTDGDEERALAPRARQSSTSGATYNPNIQSRTQQKLWLQRASSNIEPQPGIHGIPNGNTLVGANYDGRDPRVRVQLERTGLEYLVVRRYQDPIGMSIKRLTRLPGVDGSRLIPHQQKAHQRNGSMASGKYGLSQSLKETKGQEPRTKSSAASVKTNGARSSYEASQQDSESDKEENDAVEAILRRLWDKNLLDASSVE